MIVHTRGHNPGKILSAQYPSELPENYQYKLNNYAPVTIGGITRAKQEMANMVMNGNFSISQIDPSIETYINERRFDQKLGGYTMFEWWKQFYFERMADDPNGFVVPIPVGLGVEDNSVEVDIEPYLVYSISIVAMTRDWITFFKPEDQANENEKLIRVFWTIDRYAYYKHTYTNQYDDDGNMIYDTDIYYYHGMGMIPAVKIGGVPYSSVYQADYSTANKLRGEVYSWSPNTGPYVNAVSWGNMMLPYTIDYLTSFFGGYIPAADCAIRAHSNYQVAQVMTGNPVRVVEMVDCDQCNGTGYIGGNGNMPGGMGVAGAGNGQALCTGCGGGGSLVRSNMGEWQVKKRDTSLPSENRPTDIVDPIRYVTPPVEALNNLKECYESYLEKAERDVYQYYSDKVRSGDAEETIREGKYCMAQRISDNVFDNYKHFLDLCARLRNPSGYIETIIINPKGFDTPDEQDLMEELKALNDADAPPVLKYKKKIDLAKQIYSGDMNSQRMIELPAMWDSLDGMGADDITNLTATFPLEHGDELKRRHLYVNRVIANLLAEHGDKWLGLSYDRQLSDMEAKYNELTALLPKASNPYLPA
jgi:hypothetical protein